VGQGQLVVTELLELPVLVEMEPRQAFLVLVLLMLAAAVVESERLQVVLLALEAPEVVVLAALLLLVLLERPILEAEAEVAAV
jgi:hypothetical protein